MERARVSGLTEPDWLLRQVKEGAIARDFGVKGSVEEIAERDLVEVLQEKVAAIDWEEKKQQVIERFWEKQRFLELPRARRSRTRTLDPSILISDHIRDGNGNVLVAQGTLINPLELRPFTQALVIFDPLDPLQVSLVDQRLAGLKQQYPRITLIVTRFARDKGWDSYTKITDHFDAEVFILTPDIQSRFELEVTPSIVTAEQNRFVIEELAARQAEHP
jgi:conjugal transfer pilus assembly protein TraW